MYSRMNDREGVFRNFSRQYSAEVFSGQAGSKVAKSLTAGTDRMRYFGGFPSSRAWAIRTLNCALRRFVMLFLWKLLFA